MRYVLNRMAVEAEAEALRSYGAQLAHAGVLLAGDGFAPSAEGVRVQFEGHSRRLLPGPFTAAADGYWVIETADEAEAVEWARRAPLRAGCVEVRRVVARGGAAPVAVATAPPSEGPE